MSSNANQRNWRGIIIALLVIVFVLGLIVTSVVLLTPPDEGPRVKGHRFKLADVLGHEFLPLRFNGSWVSPHELIYLDHTGGISLLNVLNASSKALMNNQTFVSILCLTRDVIRRRFVYFFNAAYFTNSKRYFFIKR